jgi:hypothetical protein
MTRRKSVVSNYLRQYYKNVRPTASAADVEEFVQKNTIEYTGKAQGGRVGLSMGGDPTEWMTEEEETITPFQLQQEEGVPMGLMASHEGNTRLLQQLYEDFLDLGYSPADAAKKAREVFDNMSMKQREERSGIMMAANPDMGERVNYSIGSIPKLWKLLTGAAKSGSKIPVSTYSRMKAPIKLSDMENIPDDLLQKMFRTQELGLYKETPELLKAGNLLQRFTKEVNGKRVIDYKRAEDILGIKLKGNETLDDLLRIEFETRPEMKAQGGRINKFGGGVMDLPVRQNSAGVKELDLRDSGGFVPPIGVKEKADDIPAMLSNNEFVFTADAVRAAGGGSVEKGAQRMYDTMKKLESRIA